MPPSIPPSRPTPREASNLSSPRDRPAASTSRPEDRSRGTRRLRDAIAPILALVSLAAAFHFSGLAPWVADSVPEAEVLDPALERAVERAIRAAERDGVELRVTSGLRSASEQDELWRAALDEHGSTVEASRWVLPPELSAHVQGLAVDVGPHEGAAWLGEHGARWGLCQVFANEPWHFERLTSKNGTCPALLPDASVLLDEDAR